MKNDPNVAQRAAKNLDLAKVEKFFKNKNFQPLKLTQEWRHVTGVLGKGKEKYFFKLASTKAIGKKTRNEYEWNRLINALPQEQRLPIKVPKTYEKGYYEGLFWFISEFIEGKQLAIPTDKENTKLLEENLLIIAETAKAIINIRTDITLPNDENKKKNGDYQKVYVEHIKYWVDKIIKSDVSDLFLYFKERTKYLQMAPAHNDFVPWHIYKSRSDLYLVDGEHSGIVKVKFYDLAYFYHRVYTKLQRPDIADKFLKEFLKIWELTKYDLERLQMVMANRLLGGYYDFEWDNITSIEHQDEFKKRLLKGDIV